MPNKDTQRSLRDRASDIKESVAGTLGDILGSDDDGNDNLGPDRGTMDQLEARRERARLEARREAREEQRQQRIEQARQQGREQGRDEVFGDDSGGGLLSEVRAAVENIEVDVDNPGAGGGAGGAGGFSGGFGGGLSRTDAEAQLGGADSSSRGAKSGSQQPASGLGGVGEGFGGGLGRAGDEGEKEQLEAMGFEVEGNDD